MLEYKIYVIMEITFQPSAQSDREKFSNAWSNLSSHLLF